MKKKIFEGFLEKQDLMDFIFNELSEAPIRKTKKRVLNDLNGWDNLKILKIKVTVEYEEAK